MFLKIFVLLSSAGVLHCAPVATQQTKITGAGNELDGHEMSTLADAGIHRVDLIRSADAGDDPRVRSVVRKLLGYATADANVTAVDLKDFEGQLHDFLGRYYDEFVSPKRREDAQKTRAETSDVYDRMQSDQPVNDDYGFKPINVVPIRKGGEGSNGTSIGFKPDKANYTDGDRIREERNRENLTDMEDRSKDNWVEMLKRNILSQTGRIDISVPKTYISTLNFTGIVSNFPNGSRGGAGVAGEDDPIYTEKIRSYYPVCEIPKNTDQEVWKDENVMNLYFNFDYGDKNVTIATATLRLYRIPHENLTDPLSLAEGECENVLGEDERLLRISIYWYTKSLKRHRVKKRLCDSKVVAETARWVELSVKPATRAWIRGSKNLGLAIVVENQDGVVLKASQYFKGPSCTVGTSTPKPIPTIIVDAARQHNQMGRIDSFFGRNTTAAPDSDRELPAIDICTLEYPEGYAASAQEIRWVACNLRRMHDQSQSVEDKVRMERIATVSNLLKFAPGGGHHHHHLRHEKRLHSDRAAAGSFEPRGQGSFDPRSRMVGKTILIKNEDVARLGGGGMINR